MIFPKVIKKGDTIGLICPSSPMPKERVQQAVELIESMGYKVKCGKSVYENDYGLYAGNAKLRANDVNEMFADSKVDGIICMRGGDGSCRIMEHIDIELIKNNPKVFVGYSDITNLHTYFNSVAKLVTYHGPMVSSNMIDEYDDFTKTSFEAVLNMEGEHLLINPKGEEMEVINEGQCGGIIVGGNLTLLTTAIGTFYEVDLTDKILFIEDVNEKIERVDKMLWQLKNGKKLDKVKGIIVGDFKNCTNVKDLSYGMKELIVEVLSDLDIPIMFNIKSGHCFPMSTIPLGARCSMDTSKKEIKFYK